MKFFILFMQKLQPKELLQRLHEILKNYHKMIPISLHPERITIIELLEQIKDIPDEYNNTETRLKLFFINLDLNFLRISVPSINAIEMEFKLNREKLYKLKDFWRSYIYFQRSIEISKTKTLDYKIFNFPEISNPNFFNYFKERLIYKKLNIESQSFVLKKISKCISFLSVYNFALKDEILNDFKSFEEVKNIENLKVDISTRLRMDNSLSVDLTSEEDSSDDFSNLCAKKRSLENFDKKLKLNKIKVDDAIKIKYKKEEIVEKESHSTLKFKNLTLHEIKKIGQGGCGKVYMVYFDPNSDENFDFIHAENSDLCKHFRNFLSERRFEPQKFALKIVHCDPLDEIYDAVINEIQMLENLRGNPRVIEMYDFSVEKRQINILMEIGDIDLHKFISLKVSEMVDLNSNLNFKSKSDINTDINKNDSVIGGINFESDLFSNRREKEEEIEVIKEIKKNCDDVRCNFFYPFTENCRNLDFIGYISPDDIKNLWEQILSILNILNSGLLIHRDIKDKNLVFVENKLKVIDFGLTRKVTEEFTKHQTKHYAGTTPFMSPESLENRPLSRKSDIWSAGILLQDLVYATSFIPNALTAKNKEKDKRFGFCNKNCKCHENYKNVKNSKKLPELFLCSKHRKSVELRRYLDFIILIEKCLTFNVEERVSMSDLLYFEYNFY